jgi:hypothetical protein
MPKLLVDQRDFTLSVDQLADLAANIQPLDAHYQKLVAEIILLRLFALMESSFESIATKVLCGATYLDSTVPMVLKSCSNRVDALDVMRRHGRKKPRSQLKWTMVTDIKENLRHVLDVADPLIKTFDIHALIIDEIRRVRNHVAHRNADTRRKYRSVVQQHYGSYVPSVTPGVLLLAKRFRPILLEQYLRKAKIVLKELLRA